MLIQLQKTFTSDQPEFHILPITQQIESIFSSEFELASEYLQSHDNYTEKTLRIVMEKFTLEVDSLQELGDTTIDFQIAHLRQIHSTFTQFMAQQSAKLQETPRYNAVAALLAQQNLVDSIRIPLQAIREKYNPTLSKSLEKITEQTSQAQTNALFILGFALIIGIVFAILISKNLIRPIQLLQASTRKVGEGHYETVAVTSNDEIADLTVAFNMMSVKLRQLDEMRMQLMSEISHEMRTPLQVIKAGCYTIIHTKDSPPLTQRQRDAVGMIHQATNRINQFVNSFLDVAKMEAGLMKFNIIEADIIGVISPLVQEAQLIAQTRQIKVEMIKQEIPQLRLDKERIGQVFSNLLSNALKYTPDGGTITINAECIPEVNGNTNQGRGFVKISVQDSGVGIPEEDLEKLFNKFYQAKNVPLVNEKGSGLGLALVKHVTEAHGGTVRVTSTIDVGSTFTIVIPI